jgi:hypothetical protein
MQTIKLSKKSWHYHLIREYTANADHEIKAMDFCQYVRWVFAGILGACIATILLTFCALIIVLPLVFYSVVLFYGVWVEPNITTSVGVLCYIVVILYYIVLYTIRGVVKLFSKIPPTPISTSPFIRSAYKTIKNKVCFRLEIVD